MLTKPDTETTITSEILNHQDKSTVAVAWSDIVSDLLKPQGTQPRQHRILNLINTCLKMKKKSNSLWGIHGTETTVFLLLLLIVMHCRKGWYRERWFSG